MSISEYLESALQYPVSGIHLSLSAQCMLGAEKHRLSANTHFSFRTFSESSGNGTQRFVRVSLMSNQVIQGRPLKLVLMLLVFFDGDLVKEGPWVSSYPIQIQQQSVLLAPWHRKSLFVD